MIKEEYVTTAQDARKLNELMLAAGLANRNALINEALALYERAIEKRQQGLEVAFVDEKTDTWRAITMPGLDYAYQHRDT